MARLHASKFLLALRLQLRQRLSLPL